MSYADSDELTASTSSQYLPDWTKNNVLDKSLITRRAKRAMIDTHSEKYLAAWLNKRDYVAKIVSLESEFEDFDDEIKNKVAFFIESRGNNPHGSIPSGSNVTKAINIKMGIDALKANYHTACIEFDGYGDIIKTIKAI